MFAFEQFILEYFYAESTMHVMGEHELEEVLKRKLNY